MAMETDIFYPRQRFMVPSLKACILLILLSLSIFAESTEPDRLQKTITKGSKFGHLLGRGPFGLGLFSSPGPSSGGDGSDSSMSGSGDDSSGNVDVSRKMMHNKGDSSSSSDASGGPPVGPDGNPIISPEKPRFETNSLGKWRITTHNVGISAMQLQTMPNDKVVWFDTTFLGPSALQLKPKGNCPINFETNVPDCYAHALEYDGLHDTTRPLTVCYFFVICV